MLQEWRDAAFLHWAYDPAVVQQRLPDGLRVDTFDGRAWVGLVAFHMVGIRLPGLPRVPVLGTFPETNVRTYVRHEDGTRGVWFDSLDAEHLLPVLTARAGYRLPYMWSTMSINRHGDTIRYRSSRRWPGPSGAGGTISIEPHAGTIRPSALENHLTARWGLFTTTRTASLRYAPVEHPPWPLQRASVRHLDESLVVAAGYPAPEGPPHVLWSQGVPVRVGLPRSVR